MTYLSAVVHSSHFDDPRFAEFLHEVINCRPDTQEMINRLDCNDINKSRVTGIPYIRKLWEWWVVCETYWRYVALNPDSGRRCLGFGVGREPVAVWLVSHGEADLVVATDLAGTVDVWDDTDQKARGVLDLLKAVGTKHIDSIRRLHFYSIDMDDIDPLRTADFDFTWSCGSMEHIGGKEALKRFYLRQFDCLRPGGWCVHTTEYDYENDPSNTLDAHDICLLNDADIQDIATCVHNAGHQLLPIHTYLTPSSNPADTYVDRPPYCSPGSYHLRVEVCNGAYRTTSVSLIAQKSLRGA